ncbi:MAG: SPOR domain-containing protein [bacterium]|nr:SPOR domain-containing protein [bacterium]
MNRIIAALFVLTFFATETICAQKAFDNKNGQEIPLDDFPRCQTGYRLQIGAFSDQASAIAFRDSLRRELKIKVHLNYADRLWRVRIGDFSDSQAAKDFDEATLKKLGYQGALLVEDKIMTISTAGPAPQKRHGYRIQVKALSDREKALEYGRRMQIEHPEVRAYVMVIDSVYKIQIGDFRHRGGADAWNKNLKKNSNIDGWIVETLIYEDPPPLEFDNPAMDSFKYDTE